MLTKADDYPIHQTPEPIAYAGDSRNFYDRYFFNGYPLDGEVFFAAALGVYPALNVMDAAFSIIISGRQHNVHASRTLHMERMDTRVGPVGIEVVEPLQVLRLEVDDEANGVRAELTFTGRFPAIEEPRFTRRVGSQIMMDYTRLTQNGAWTGWIEVAGERHEVTPERWQGTRDRSWGIRSVGMRDPQPNPYGTTPQFFWLWAPVNFPDAASFYHLNADGEGRPWNTMGRIVAAHGPEELEEPASELSYASGTRLAAQATIQGTSAEGPVALTFEPKATFYMRGLGYGHPEWGHGLFHGEADQGFESYDLSAIDPADPAYFHVQAICDVKLERGGQTQAGKGVLEQLVIGPYEPYGFKDLIDLAP